MITESILRKRLDYRGMGREKGRSIHSYLGSVVEGILLFLNTIFKVSTCIQITVISTLINRTDVEVLPAPSVPQTDKQNLQNFTDITQVQDPSKPLKPPDKQDVQNFTGRLHKITGSPSLQKLLYWHEAAALGTGFVPGTVVKYEPGFSVALHPCETSVRENNSSWEESCTSLCGRFHSGTLGENNVLEVATAIITVVERVSAMWFILILFIFQDSELCGSDG